MTTPTDSAKLAVAKTAPPSEVVTGVDVPFGIFVEVAVAEASAVATVATVSSSTGVVVYVMVSKANAVVEKGRLDTGDALANASLSDAGASGVKDARSKSPGLSTLYEKRASQHL